MVSLRVLHEDPEYEDGRFESMAGDGPLDPRRMLAQRQTEKLSSIDRERGGGPYI